MHLAGLESCHDVSRKIGRPGNGKRRKEIEVDQDAIESEDPPVGVRLRMAENYLTLTRCPSPNTGLHKSSISCPLHNRY